MADSMRSLLLSSLALLTLAGCTSGIERLDEIGVKSTETLTNFRTETGFEMINMRSVDVPPEVDFDEFLEVARGVKHIKVLRVTGHTLTCDHIDALVDIGGFTTLVFDETQVPSECLARLGEIQSIEKLAINNAAIESDQLAFVADLPKLNTVTLIGTNIDDALMEHLTDVERLRNVFVSKSAVTDAFAAELAKLPKVMEVQVDDTAITSAGVVALFSGPRISRIHATHVPFDETIQSGLKQQRPSLKTMVLDVPKTINATTSMPVTILPPHLSTQRDDD